MTGSQIEQFLLILPVLLLSLAAHEMAHAAVATALGDPTPQATGRLTLNPLAHLDVFGTLVLVVSYFVGGFLFGWARPVQIDPSRFRYKRGGEALVAASGPATNFVLAVSCGLISNVLLNTSELAAQAFYWAFYLNMILAIFNILPIPPLDGWRVVTDLLPPSARRITDRILPYEGYVFMAFFVLLILRPEIFTVLFQPPIDAMTTLLLP